jgi:hypothetical protein
MNQNTIQNESKATTPVIKRIRKARAKRDIFEKKDTFEKIIGYRVGTDLNTRIENFCKAKNISITQFHTAVISEYLRKQKF